MQAEDSGDELLTRQLEFLKTVRQRGYDTDCVIELLEEAAREES